MIDIDSALRSAGLDLGRLTPRDLAPVDQIHARGPLATEDLAAMADIQASDRVLDVGCGVGGPARHLAATRQCTVVGIDLAASYVDLAIHLTALTHLGDRVSFRRADALHLPFEAGAFDVVWTQHVAMNIADRSALYAELNRVLRPGGRLAIFDVVEGNGAPLDFPVPWASNDAESFLVTADAMRVVLETSGFAVREWRDVTEASAAWLASRPTPPPSAPPSTPAPLGIHLLLGPSFPIMLQNFTRNVADGRARFVMAVLEKR